MKITHLTVIAAIACLAQTTRVAGEDAYDPFEHPNPQTAAFYKSNREAIADATKKAKNTASTSAERVSALQLLFDKYGDQAILASAELVRDSDLGVAALAAEILSNAAVMMDHKMSDGSDHAHGGHGPEAPLIVQYAMKKHDLIMAGLRTAVADKREGVRTPSARILASQSDAIGLKRISEAASEGIYSESEAVKILALAAPKSSASYVEKYLNSKNEDVQSLAVECLRDVPQYRTMVRDKYLLNPTAPLKVRLTAAKGLTEARDLIPLIASANTPAALYKQAMQTYLKLEGEHLSAGELQYLQDGLKRLPFPAEELKSVDAALSKLRQSKSP